MLIEYEYNIQNIVSGEEITVSYAYDGTGTRIGKTVNGVSTGQIWNNGNVIAEYGTKGTKTYIRGAGGEIVKTKDSANNNRYFSYNAHGDTTNIIEKNAESTSFAVTAAYEYDAFGGLVTGTGGEADSNGFRYNGQYTDEETGLIYLRNRYYDPSIGRFTQEDPYWNPTNMIYGDGKKSTVIVKYNNDNTTDMSCYANEINSILIKNYGKVEFISSKYYNEYIENNLKYEKLLGTIKEENDYFINDVSEGYSVYSVILIPKNDIIKQSINLYCYCCNNPLKYDDRIGLSVYFIGANITAGIGIYIAADAMLVWDDEGNMGIMIGCSIGGGALVPGIGGLVGQYNNLDNIYQLCGQSVSAGVAAEFGFEYQGSNGASGFALVTGLGFYGAVNYGWMLCSWRMW